MMDNNLFLTEPKRKYQNSFIKAVMDYKEAGEIEYYNLYKASILDFGIFVKMLQDHARGVNLPRGWSKYLTYWLTNDEDEILGIVRIRYKSLKLYGHLGYDVPPSQRKNGYGNKLLKLTIEKAEEMGIDELMVTCDYDNEASIKVVKNNGGVYIDQVYDHYDNIPVNRYKIKTKLSG